MRMQEICRACGVTRKALDYYEAKGLIAPSRTENGYRNFTAADAARLDEIGVLRRCGLSVEEVRRVLTGGDRQATLRACIARQEREMQAMEEKRRALERLCAEYDVAREKALLSGLRETASEKLRLAFPGFFGEYLALHFGRFLDVPLDTDEKWDAWTDMLDWLDNARIPPEIEALTRQVYGEDGFPSSAFALEKQTHAAMEAMLADPAKYWAENAGAAEAWQAARRSEAYRNSPAARLEEALRAFQRQSGYCEVFLEDMKRISPAYRDWADRLSRADAAFAEAEKKGSANEIQMPCSRS